MPFGTNGHCCQWLNVNIHVCYEEHVIHFRKFSTLKSGYINVINLLHFQSQSRHITSNLINQYTYIVCVMSKASVYKHT
jgi:hypothetical protein